MCESIINSQTSNDKVDTDNYIAGYAETNRSNWYANNNGNNNIKCDINDYNSIYSIYNCEWFIKCYFHNHVLISFIVLYNCN